MENLDNKLQEITKKISNFKHISEARVRFAEVDSFGVVHNVQYFYWLEWARTEYFRALGLEITPRTFIRENLMMVVSAQIDYYAPARFADEYEVLTRIAFIKNSSFGFENIIRLKNGTLLACAEAVLVYLDPKTLTPTRVTDELRRLIQSFENNNLRFIDE